MSGGEEVRNHARLIERDDITVAQIISLFSYFNKSIVHTSLRQNHMSVRSLKGYQCKMFLPIKIIDTWTEYS